MLFDVQYRRVYLMGLLVLCLNMSSTYCFGSLASAVLSH
jgi:hypothetical protein